MPPVNISNIKFKLNGKLIIEEFAFTKMIARQSVAQINRAFRLVRDRKELKVAVQEEFERNLRKQPEIVELSGGELQGILGLTNRQVRKAIDEIMNFMRRSIKVEFEPARLTGPGSWEGSLTVLLDSISLEELANASFGNYAGASKKYGFTYVVEWLKWILMEGSAVVIPSFRYTTSLGNKGRSGQGFMIKHEDFRIPPEYQGTVNDNFYTRAAEATVPFIGRQIIEQIRRA